ncbi:MAG TPA: hypothetical protein VF527_08675 [Pyrinomonadaceae bacterium]|jgi:hypothetical protein
MINLQTCEQTYVSRLRVRGSGLDPLAAQLRLASLFQAAEVQPSGLAPSAIVCIRRLDDPRPRTVSLAGGHLSLPSEWQQSVRASIEQLARHAPRPALGTVAADAPCVVFADRAELLAALARDWCEQRVASRWWWRSLFKETLDAGALVKLWRETPEYLPGALEHLARRRQAVAFARALAPDAARAILDSLMRRFALDELRFAVFAAPQNASHAEEAGTRAEASLSEASPRDTTGEDLHLSPRDHDAADAPWRSFVPEATSYELDVPQQCLLGIGLALQRAPAHARSRGFALRVNAWLNAPSSGQAVNAAPPPDLKAREMRGATAPRIEPDMKPGAAATRDAMREQEDARAASPVSVADGAQHPPSETSCTGADADAPILQDPDARTPAHAISSHDGATAVRDETTQVASSERGARDLSYEGVESVAPEVESVAGQHESARVAGTLEARDREREAYAPLIPSTKTEAMPAAVSPLLEAQIETQFGGLFHLVNLALFLDLYGDFTTPAAPGIELPIWDFVALLGRRMGGARVETDAVWPLLAQLAGRAQGQSPGADFRPPDAWRVEAGWLRMFPASDGWRWAISREADRRGANRRGAARQSRLQVVHPAKFLVLDVPLDSEGEAEAQLARELKAYAQAFAAPPVPRARPFKLRGRTPLARWVERLHLYARARLQLALGTGDASRAARLLCERYARVYVTATHIDIVMRLAELPFEVRVAGLDRDPGWIPAAGRFVAFHFE